MSTIRVAERQRFTTVDRGTVNDVALSFRARGILVWLLDKPDGWTVKAEAIAKAGKEGRDAVRAALHELERAGYLLTTRHRDDLGRWTSENVIYERPQTDSTVADNPETSTGFPATDNQHRETRTGFPGPIESTENEDCDIPPHPQQLKAGSDRPLKTDDEESAAPRDSRLRRAQDACDILAERAHDDAVARGAVHTSIRGHLEGCRRAARTDHLPRAQLLAHEDRKATPEAIADRIQLEEQHATGELDVRSQYHDNDAERREYDATAPEAIQERNVAGAAAARAALREQRAKTETAALEAREA